MLRVDGTLSPGFRWPDAADKREPLDVLRAEGVEFDDHGRTNPQQRVTTLELAQLLTVDVDDLGTGSAGIDVDGGQKFRVQLEELQSAAVVDGVRQVLDRWVEVGGTLEFGFGDETSCFFMTTVGDNEPLTIWPLAIYPSGRCEVVFQHLARRPPFDDVALREQLRQRLNRISGVELSAVKIGLRPSFPLSALATPSAQQLLAEELRWFVAVARRG